jgi:hypothetical protein
MKRYSQVQSAMSIVSDISTNVSKVRVIPSAAVDVSMENEMSKACP